MLIRGDLFDVLPTLAEASIDACVTDPPYGIGFMGKEWDSFRRALNPNDVGRASVFGRISRTSPAFEVNPNLKGRSRSPAVSPSQIEYDRTVNGLRGFQEWTTRWATEVDRVLKPGAYLVVCGAPRSFHRMACGIEDAGFEVRDCFSWLFGQGFPKSLNLPHGRGTALKPAWEPIIVARKPFKGTVAGNVEKHGTGALNIDACRIESEPWTRSTPYKDDIRGGALHAGKEARTYDVGSQAGNDLGRWPANVLLDEEAAEMLDEQSGELVSGARAGGDVQKLTDDAVLGFRAGRLGGFSEASSGGASRFYYVAKPDREERDFGTQGIAPKPRDESRKAGNPGGDNPRNRGLQPRGNFHPTVKPVALMRWLVRLVTPPHGTVLDPFTGSGTTGMACRYEFREFIGIEREAEYVEIAEARIAAVAPLFAEAVQ